MIYCDNFIIILDTIVNAYNMTILILFSSSNKTENFKILNALPQCNHLQAYGYI